MLDRRLDAVKQAARSLPYRGFSRSKAASPHGGLTELAVSKFGKKFTCWSCGTKFYDLNKPQPSCPKCGEDPNAAPADRPAAPAFDDDEEDGIGDVGSAGHDEEE